MQRISQEARKRELLPPIAVIRLLQVRPRTLLHHQAERQRKCAVIVMVQKDANSMNTKATVNTSKVRADFCPLFVPHVTVLEYVNSVLPPRHLAVLCALYAKAIEDVRNVMAKANIKEKNVLPAMEMGNAQNVPALD